MLTNATKAMWKIPRPPKRASAHRIPLSADERRLSLGLLGWRASIKGARLPLIPHGPIDHRIRDDAGRGGDQRGETAICAAGILDVDYAQQACSEGQDAGASKAAHLTLATAGQQQQVPAALIGAEYMSSHRARAKPRPVDRWHMHLEASPEDTDVTEPPAANTGRTRPGPQRTRWCPALRQTFLRQHFGTFPSQLAEQLGSEAWAALAPSVRQQPAWRYLCSWIEALLSLSMKWREASPGWMAASSFQPHRILELRIENATAAPRSLWYILGRAGPFLVGSSPLELVAVVFQWRTAAAEQRRVGQARQTIAVCCNCRPKPDRIGRGMTE